MLLYIGTVELYVVIVATSSCPNYTDYMLGQIEPLPQIHLIQLTRYFRCVHMKLQQNIPCNFDLVLVNNLSHFMFPDFSKTLNRNLKKSVLYHYVISLGFDDEILKNPLSSKSGHFHW